MADSFVLRNGGDFVLRNGGDKILRNPIVVVVPPEGGGSGGKVRSKGHQLTDLGPRPHVIETGESKSFLVVRPVNKSKSRLTVRVQGESICKTIPYFGGASISQLVMPVKAESTSRLYFKDTGESLAVNPYGFLMEKMQRTSKVVKAMNYLRMIDSLD